MSLSKYSVRLLPIAEEDLEEIVSYIAADHLTAASAFVEKIEKTLRRLASYPALGRVPHDARLSTMGYRFLVVEDYLVFYTIHAQTVLIHRVVHGARDIRALL